MALRDLCLSWRVPNHRARARSSIYLEPPPPPKVPKVESSKAKLEQEDHERGMLSIIAARAVVAENIEKGLDLHLLAKETLEEARFAFLHSGSPTESHGCNRLLLVVAGWTIYIDGQDVQYWLVKVHHKPWHKRGFAGADRVLNLPWELRVEDSPTIGTTRGARGMLHF